jgi:hypothetical protein
MALGAATVHQYMPTNDLTILLVAGGIGLWIGLRIWSGRAPVPWAKVTYPRLNLSALPGAIGWEAMVIAGFLENAWARTEDAVLKKVLAGLVLGFAAVCLLATISIITLTLFKWPRRLVPPQYRE